MKKHKVKRDDAQECFNLCSLVGFAKYKANKEDFDRIMKLAYRIVKK